MKDSTAWIAVGGLAALGGWLWIRQGGHGGTVDPLALTLDDIGLGGLSELFGPQRSLPVSGPVPYAVPPPPPPIVRIGPVGPSVGEFSTRTGIAAGTTVGIAAIGPGTVAVAAATAGIGAGVAALYYAIAVKGWLRGGEEALHVNPLRDKYIALFGPPGTGEGSGFFNLAAGLFEITHDHRYMDAIKGADTLDEFVAATIEVQKVFASVGVTVPAFER